ncbi:extracellular solute-binding protein [Flexivirga sp. ID2601S]|uniref:Extracellular solute-binding protein n=1 Tax=Flexivirga aerilata TaxID=1656889 RepID=A0A849AHF9_9MICO|nr:extracellular solute-binding protein [Flexivirga aerilata]NNG39297.1 extracellular solute-binding protein [Flexivirga aerilata]
MPDPTAGVSRRTALWFTASSVIALPLGLSGCGSDSGDAVKLTYKQFGSGTIMGDFLRGVSSQFAAAGAGFDVDLIPLVASENDYYTKTELMMSSGRTAPDLIYEDTFILNSDIAAGYLRPIDDYLATWPDWKLYYPTTRDAVKYTDGKHYGVPLSTDTRAIWFNRRLLAKAGLPERWQPRTWDDILTAARTIKQKLPGVVPINIWSSKAMGEATAMQGFEMLLYGTGSTLYDEQQRKWVTGSPGFTDALRFMRTISAEKLGLQLSDALDPNMADRLYNTMWPHDKIAMAVDGSWIPGGWTDSWPDWAGSMSVAKMPTQHGAAPGVVTMSGGFCWAIPKRAKNPDRAFEFVRTMCNRTNNTDYCIKDSQIAVRSDVAAEPRYQKSSPTTKFMTSLVKDTTYRPALAPYPQISNAIQIACEAMLIGSKSPAAAAAAYDSMLIDIVGRDQTTKAGA